MATAAPLDFDLGRDFSFSSNPNGPWRYGSTTGATLSPAHFAISRTAAVTGGLRFWEPGPGRGGHYPYVTANVGTATVTDPTGALVFRPGEAGLEATDVHVLLDSQRLFAAEIDAYGGDPAFFPRQGKRPDATYQATHDLSPGQVLTFAVGFGENRTHYNDTTGLSVTVRERRRLAGAGPGN
jgi:hypothetical protein